MKVGIIGQGRMGSELSRRIPEKGWEIRVVARTSGIYTLGGEKIDELNNWLEHFKKVDIACLCISTLDDGKAAYEYMKTLAENEIPVVTCEKGALGNYFPELKDWLNKIGYSASVGGKTGMAPWLKDKITPTVKEIHGVINATLNYIFDGVGEGRILEEVVEEAKNSGYTKPGAIDPLEVINKESTQDIPMKTAVLFNASVGDRFGPLIRASDISAKAIQQDELRRLIREAAKRRYIVSITKEDQEEDVIGGFKHPAGDWIISAGFKKKDENPLFLWLNPKGVDNALVVYEGIYGRIGLIGEGAGPRRTVSSMIRDMENFLRIY